MAMSPIPSVMVAKFRSFEMLIRVRFIYLTVILDAYTRAVRGWALGRIA